MSAASAPPARGRILVVDDNPIIQRTLQFALKERGYEVLVAGEIAGALKYVRQEHPDLILLDINFPPDASTVGGGLRDGFWALEWMRYLEEIKGIPIIIISGDDPATAKPHALAAGAAAYLHKPINQDELLTLITELIPRRPAA